MYRPDDGRYQIRKVDKSTWRLLKEAADDLNYTLKLNPPIRNSNITELELWYWIWFYLYKNDLYDEDDVLQPQTKWTLSQYFSDADQIEKNVREYKEEYKTPDGRKVYERTDNYDHIQKQKQYCRYYKQLYDKVKKCDDGEVLDEIYWEYPEVFKHDDLMWEEPMDFDFKKHLMLELAMWKYQSREWIGRVSSRIHSLNEDNNWEYTRPDSFIEAIVIEGRRETGKIIERARDIYAEKTGKGRERKRLNIEYWKIRRMMISLGVAKYHKLEKRLELTFPFNEYLK